MNINRDYLIINDVKKSNITLDNGSMFFYITDKNTQNIFVNLVINVSNNDLIQKYANIENAEDYTLTMNIIKPNNDYKIIEGKLHDKEKGIFEFNLKKDCCDVIGTYKCELLTKCNINEQEEITTSNSITYIVKKSILNDLDDIVKAPEYPVVIQLLDKLSDIDQYEEDRRTNELARQLAEEQRQARFNALDADMTDRVTAMDNKMVDVENRVSAKEQAVDKLITDTKTDIDEYKVAKDQEIDDYKTAKDTEINNAITAQDNKIDEAIANQDNKIDIAISNQNDRITLVENNDTTQNNRLDTLENRATTHESRLTGVEAKNTEQDGRLDIVENKNQQQDNRLDTIGAKNIEQDNRLDDIEVIDIAQNTRLDAIEVKNQQQDDRLLDIEKVNKRQDMNLKCLFAESKNNMIDITEKGNSISLQNSTIGYTLIDEIKGNTLVNCNKEADKELILNGNINTSGDNTVTITEGVDGGKVDVALEGNTLVNVSKTKDSTAISKAYTVENSGNHIALQGDIDGSCRPVVTGNTLVNLCKLSRTSNNVALLDNPTRITGTVTIINAFKSNKVYVNRLEVSDNTYAGATLITSNVFKLDMPTGQYIYSIYDNTNTDFIPPTTLISDVLILEGDWTDKVIPDYFEGLQSSFEDNLVTQEMVDSGEEVADNLGKYRVDYKSTKEDGTVGSTKTLYLNSPLLEGDTIEEKDGGVYHVHRSKEVVFDGSGDEGWVQSLSNDSTKPNYFIWAEDMFYKYTNDNQLCDKMRISNPYDDYSQNIVTIINGSARIRKDDYLEVGISSWLQSNPITLVAQLVEPTYELIEQSNLVIPSYANGHLDFDTAVPVEKVEFKPFIEELTYLYANTQYTLQFISDEATTADITLGGTQLLAQNIVAGLNRIAITTPATLVDNKLVISGVGANISEVVVADTDRELEYFEGMKSVGEGKELQVISINSERRLVNTQRLTHEPLRGTRDAKDRYVLIDGKWYIKRKCGIRAYQEGDEDNYKTDLVNTVYPLEMPTYEEIDYNPLQVYSGVTNITTNSTIPPNITVKNHGFNCLLKPSTTYTISSNLGLNTVTTPSTLTEDCLRFMDTDTSDITTMKDVLVLEGDWTSKADLIPANFSGIESAFEQEYDTEKGKYKVNVKVIGKNLFDAKAITNYSYQINNGITPSCSSDGEVVLNGTAENIYDFRVLSGNNIGGNISNNRPLFEYIHSLPNGTSLTLSNDLGFESYWILFRNGKTTYHKDTINIQTGDLINCFIRVPLGTTLNNQVIHIQIEQGNTASEYEPYKENNITFYINEPLRGIGDVKDRIYVIDDKVVVERNCGSLVLDGSNRKPHVWSNSPGNIVNGYYNYNEVGLPFNITNIKIINNKLPSNIGGHISTVEGFRATKNFFAFSIHKAKLGIINVNDAVNNEDIIRQWLQQNPITVVHQLEEPVYEEVEYNDTKLFMESFKNSTLFYNSNVPVTSKLYYSYSVPIVDTVAQTANVTDQQDSMIIDLATQVAVMEMMLM